jgi:hypothetical protein
VVEGGPVDEADGALLHGERALLGRRHHRDRPGAREPHQLDRQRPEAARGAPDKDDVALLDGVRRPAVEHPICGRAGECRRRRLLPRERLGLGQALMRLHLGELRERAPARVVAPHPERRGQTGIPAIDHPRVLEVPLAGVDDDPVPRADVRHAFADRVDDARRVRTDDVEIGRFAPPRLRLGDVDGHAASGPDVVEVDARRHDHHERLVGTDRGDVDHLVADRVLGVAVPVGPDQLRVHTGRHLADRRDLADVVHVLGHARSVRGRGCGRR